MGRSLLADRSSRRHAAACARILRLRLRPEGNGDLLHVVAATLQLGDQRLYVELRTAFNEGDLLVGDDDALDCAARWQIESQ